jgi:DNA-binding protein YbaB
MELDPGPAQTLALLGKFQSAMEGQMNQMAGGEYKASDTEKSVDVTLNGYQWLTKLCIQPGLLKEIGADGVAARVNAAECPAGGQRLQRSRRRATRRDSRRHLQGDHQPTAGLMTRARSRPGPQREIAAASRA